MLLHSYRGHTDCADHNECPYVAQHPCRLSYRKSRYQGYLKCWMKIKGALIISMLYDVPRSWSSPLLRWLLVLAILNVHFGTTGTIKLGNCLLTNFLWIIKLGKLLHRLFQQVSAIYKDHARGWGASNGHRAPSNSWKRPRARQVFTGTLTLQSPRSPNSQFVLKKAQA